MSVLVDTGVFYAHHDRDAERHEDAVAAMDALLDGEFGKPYSFMTLTDTVRVAFPYGVHHKVYLLAGV